jgi:hypothetical protein
MLLKHPFYYVKERKGITHKIKYNSTGSQSQIDSYIVTFALDFY